MSLYEQEYECFGCSSKENALDDANYWFKYILDQIYSDDALDNDEFERALQELCAVVKIKMPKKAFTLHKTTSNKLPAKPENVIPLDDWVKFNNQYLAQLTYS